MISRNSILTYKYDEKFFEYIEVSSGPSAKQIVPILLKICPTESVLDIGCGRGAWAAVWAVLGVEDIQGVDGDYVEPYPLLRLNNRFSAFDLGKHFNLGRMYDVVTCFEVGEHIDPLNAGIFVDNIASHGDVVFFSAAVPGQGGEFHINEQPLDYWVNLFRLRGFDLFDAVRPQLIGLPDIEPWYKYNMLLFVRDTAFHRLPDWVLSTRVAPGEQLVSYAPLLWRIRCAIVSIMPIKIVNFLACIKHRCVALFSKSLNG
jgi:hypothetical protein